jgi:hypothetical protein
VRFATAAGRINEIVQAKHQLHSSARYHAACYDPIALDEVDQHH